MKESHMAVPKGQSIKMTPKNVQGGNGKNVTIKPDHFMNKPTKKTMFPC